MDNDPEIYKLKLENFKKKKLNNNKNLKKLLLFIFLLINLYIIFNLIYKRKIKNYISEFIHHEIKNNLNQIKQLVDISNHLKKELKLINDKQKLLFTFKKYDILSKNLKANNDIIKILKPMDVIDMEKIRIGKNYDGGYILLNDFENVKIAYSFGISHEISFDKGLADKNIDVFMYDHTISKLPYDNPRFHWNKIGLSTESNKKKHMKTLDELIKENNHSNENNLILKIDIESHEWNIFENITIDTLKKFKHIVGEFHLNDKNKYICLEILKKIQTTHQIIHLHCNNCAYRIINIDGYYICAYLEISLVLKDSYSFNRFQSRFPINGLDFPNCKKKQELDFLLNSFI